MALCILSLLHSYTGLDNRNLKSIDGAVYSEFAKLLHRADNRNLKPLDDTVYSVSAKFIHRADNKI